MLLSARILTSVGNVNSFEYAQQFQLSEGDSTDVYFQLIDASLDSAQAGFVPSGRRYMSAAGATLSVVLDSLLDSKKITKVATQPFALDPSIWKFSISSTDNISGTVGLRLTLTEGAKVTKGWVQGAIGVSSLTGLC